MLATLEKLWVIESFGRLSVSDDKAYLESLFKTLKYHTTFPCHEPLADISAARCWTKKFVTWYNIEYMHGGLKFVTPHQYYTGEDKLILKKRHAVCQLVKQKRPKR